ncbi:MAG: hypothetical protein ACOC3H_02980 [bacterium]
MQQTSNTRRLWNVGDIGGTGLTSIAVTGCGAHDGTNVSTTASLTEARRPS